MIEEVVSEKHVPSEKYARLLERISSSVSGLCMKICEMIRLHMAVGRNFRNFIFGSDMKICD